MTDPAKTCTICGEDCSARPRIKDRRGRYACRACVEARAAAEPDPMAETRVDADAIDDDPAPSSTGVTEATLPGRTAVAAEPPAAVDLPDRCPSCGVDLPDGADLCHACGARLDAGGAGVRLDRLTAMGFLFSEDGAWAGGSKILVGITLGLALLSPFVGGCLFADVVIFAMLAVVAWGWAVASAWLDRDRAWAAVLLPAYPLVGPGTLAAFYYTLLVTRRIRLKRFHQLLLACGLIVGAAWGVRIAQTDGVFDRLRQQFSARSAPTP